MRLRPCRLFSAAYVEKRLNLRRLFLPRFCEKSRMQKPFVTLLLLFGKISGFAVPVRDSYIRTKDSRRTTMKLTDFYAYTVQHRRAASLAKLRKLLGGSYGQ